jgi:hypothetical protein
MSDLLPWKTDRHLSSRDATSLGPSNPAVTELSGYQFKMLREDSEFALSGAKERAMLFQS